MIRPIELYEIYKVIPVCQKFFKESGEIGCFNTDFFVSYWHKVVASGAGLIFASFDSQGDVKGAFSVIVCQEDTTGDWTIQEKWWYGDARLFAHVMKWAQEMKAHGIKAMYLSHTNCLTPGRLKEFYERRGFVSKYTRYAKEL